MQKKNKVKLGDIQIYYDYGYIWIDREILKHFFYCHQYIDELYEYKYSYLDFRKLAQKLGVYLRPYKKLNEDDWKQFKEHFYYVLYRIERILLNRDKFYPEPRPVEEPTLETETTQPEDDDDDMPF